MGKLVDITGQRFGRLTVIERAPTPEEEIPRRAFWRCKCDCGRYITTRGVALRNGHTKSCGCLQHELRRRRRGADLTGQRFGRLTALYRVPAPKYYVDRSCRWHCQCDCGMTTEVTGGALRHGNTKSCGCLNDEVRRLSNKERKERHGR